MKPEEERRSVVLQVKVTQAEADYIRLTARDNLVTVSSLIRDVMVGMLD